MVADGTATGAAAAAAGMTALAGGGSDGLREETLLQQKLAEYATFIGKFGLGAAVLATAAMTARFRCGAQHEELPASANALHALPRRGAGQSRVRGRACARLAPCPA